MLKQCSLLSVQIYQDPFQGTDSEDTALFIIGEHRDYVEKSIK